MIRRAPKIPISLCSQQERRIRLHEIERWAYQEVHHQQILKFWVAAEKFALSASMLDRGALFWEIAALTGCSQQVVESEVEASGHTSAHRHVGGSVYILGVKVMGLFSFCGGPLFWSDDLNPIWGREAASGLTFAPVARLIYGSVPWG